MIHHYYFPRAVRSGLRIKRTVVLAATMVLLIYVLVLFLVFICSLFEDSKNFKDDGQVEILSLYHFSFSFFVDE